MVYSHCRVELPSLVNSTNCATRRPATSPIKILMSFRELAAFCFEMAFAGAISSGFDGAEGS